MNLLSVENITKTFGERILFENISFGISEGDKMALVAANGSGKTTLLQILQGTTDADSGKVVYRNNIRKAFLSQDPDFTPDFTIQQIMDQAHSTIKKIIHQYEYISSVNPQNYSGNYEDDLSNSMADMETYNAWDYDRKLKNMLHVFGIEDVTKKITNLSGGQKKRLALALVLMDNPQLLILDEPTNHLDIEMIEWLEEYLQQSGLALLMVTHDRYFLDRVCTKILELTHKKIYVHQGNYSYFLEKSEERKEIENIEIEKAKQLFKKELDWMRRMPKARTTKSKARIDSFYEIEAKAKSKKIEQQLRLEMKMNRLGGKIAELKNIRKQFGNQIIIDSFTYTFLKGDRIGIIGKNGVGKSTFLNILMGKEPFDSGHISTGDTIVYGHYTQDGMLLKEDKRVIEVVKEIAEYIPMNNGTSISASQFLQHFLFPPEMQYTYVSKLSGGERRRLHLLTVLIKNPNFLILDEPTNDLDLLTLNKLEDFLESYSGCLIIVSHDRYFMDKLVDHLFVFEGDGKIRDYVGTYSEFREEEDYKELQKLDHSKKESISDTKSELLEVKSEKRKLSYKEKLELENLEKEIEKLEKEKKNLELDFQSMSLSSKELQEKGLRMQNLVEELDAKTLRWMELTEMF